MAKQKKKGFVRSSLKSMVNFPRWMGWREISKGGSVLSSSAKALFTPAKETHHETFEEAAERLNLDEAALAKRQKEFLYMALFYSVCGLALFGYMIFVFATTHFLAGILTLSLTGLLFALAFRAHFWYTQMRHRKLGCTFTDWIRLNLKSPKKD